METEKKLEGAGLSAEQVAMLRRIRHKPLKGGDLAKLKELPPSSFRNWLGRNNKLLT